MNSYDPIARYYDAEHDKARDDIEFYLRMVQGGPVLEVGTGTGRIMLPLLESGIEVWGIEPSASMRAIASRRLASFPGAQLIAGRVEDMALDRQFRAAILPLNVLWHVGETQDQLAALNSVRRHLERGALLVVDLSNPHTLADRGAWGEARERFSGQVDGNPVTGFSAAWDDESAQNIRLHLWYDEVGSNGELRRTEAELDLHYIYRFELELLLMHSGFVPDRFYGSYDLDEYGAASTNIIAVATAG